MMTPRQTAHSVAIDWLRNAYEGRTSDLDDLTPAAKRDTRRAIAKLHNQLLEQSRMEGTELDTTVQE